jgi:hypothetical protein
MNKEEKVMLIIEKTCAHILKGKPKEKEKAIKNILRVTENLIKTIENEDAMDLQQKLAKIEMSLVKLTFKEKKAGRGDDEYASCAFANALGIGFALSLLWQEEIRREKHGRNQLIVLKSTSPPLYEELMEIASRE